MWIVLWLAIITVASFYCGAVMATGRQWPFRNPLEERRHRKMHDV